MQMDDVTREAQNFGYECGRNSVTSDKYKKYSHLQAAYCRGWEMGLRDRERAEKNGRITTAY